MIKMLEIFKFSTLFQDFIIIIIIANAQIY